MSDTASAPAKNRKVTPGAVTPQEKTRRADITEALRRVEAAQCEEPPPVQAPPTDFSDFTVEVDATAAAKECAAYAISEHVRLYDPLDAAITATSFADAVVTKAEANANLHGENALRDGRAFIMAEYTDVLGNVFSEDDMQANIDKLVDEDTAANAAWAAAEVELDAAQAATTESTGLLAESLEASLGAAKTLVLARAKNRAWAVRAEYAKGKAQAIKLVHTKLAERLAELESMATIDSENRSRVKDALTEVSFFGDELANSIIQLVADEKSRRLSLEEGA